MVQLNLRQREITLKIVYYGPALSGKTTNLQVIHRLLDPGSRGRLMTLDTADDRTLFFDLMPVFFQSASGFLVKLKLFTVPGQVMHNSTRRRVLRGADGIAFIADSQRDLTQANNDSWRDMVANMKLNGLDPKTLPVVIQFNKRDLPNIRSDEELRDYAQKGKEPVFKATAITGEGVLKTFEGLVRLVWRNLNGNYSLESKLSISEDEFLAQILKRPSAASMVEDAQGGARSP